VGDTPRLAEVGSCVQHSEFEARGVRKVTLGILLSKHAVDDFTKARYARHVKHGVRDMRKARYASQ
jgi:hypothetical protein